MYKIAEYIGPHAKRYAGEKAPHGMGLSEGLSERADAVLIYGSSFEDPGDDFTRIVAFDAEGVKLATITLEGY